ncbi:phosphinothricin acetyltransferase [Breznakia blatticola]|uniref:Phosphinothricin acetyltransferase n=1 Tax=Breznakia blatticola TaxID=1754012 RepID=A0A4R8A7C9_9FIRM|nr:GNAT family N-acetyltransferase [Breznakia blatticola]TDW25738.1 phosphinothricin acetyltransferase [Breznakia blatticola]
MDITIREMKQSDWKQVASIYKQGIETNLATFQTEIPTYDAWDKSHLKQLRYVACIQDKVVGWVALSSTSSREVYKGVCEISVYIDRSYAGCHIASNLYEQMIPASEKQGIWTLQAGIMEENIASIKLHEKHGFRNVGYRERIGKDILGIWRNTILMERRSACIK